MTSIGLRTFLRIGAACLLIVALAAVGTIQTSAQSDEIIVPLEELNSSGVNGDATLTDNGDGTTTIDVLVDGASGDHPIHLHAGTCEELGEIVVPLTNVDADGASITDVPLDLATIQSAQHSINIHLSEEEIATYVACGAIPVADAEGVGGEEDMSDDEMGDDEMGDDMGGETGATTTPATGIGSTVGTDSSLMAAIAFVAAALGLAGLGLRRADIRI